VEIDIPLDIQKQAAKLDEDVCVCVFHVVAPAVGPWQWQWQQWLNKLRGAKPLAFGQYGELGLGLEDLLDTIAEAGAGEAAERYLTNHHLAAKSVQRRLMRQRVVMAVQNHRLTLLTIASTTYYTLPDWDGAKGREVRCAGGGLPRKRVGAGVRSSCLVLSSRISISTK
jgi:hypothetical protein